MSVIPKIIMQTWKDDKVPEKWKSSPSSIQKLMPEYEYVFMTDEDNDEFVRENFPQYQALWNSLKYGVQKADVIRYMFLYMRGGYYVDLDLEARKSFNLLPQGELLFVPSANDPGCLTNSFLASIPKHPIWLELLDRLGKPPSWAVGKHLEVMYSTGPKIFDRVVKESLYSFVSLSPLSLGSACICNYNKEIPGAFFMALDGGSWLPPFYLTLIRFFLCSSKDILYYVFGFLLLLIVLITALC